MKSTWFVLLGLAVLGYGLLRTVATQICQEEMRTRLSRLPNSLIYLAASRLPGQAREEFGHEWRAELAFMLRDTAGLPLTRLFRGTRYAMSLLWASRGLASELSGDETGVYPNLGASITQEVFSLAQAIGYNGPTACVAAGISYRQLDYWARTGLVEPSLSATYGSNSRRLYSFLDILALRVIKRLLDTGISLSQIRAATRHLYECKATDFARLTLMSDGKNVYGCTSLDEIVDLLANDRGVFGIAVSQVWIEIESTLSKLPAEQAETPGQ